MMLRILLILSLTLIIGAHKQDLWKDDLHKFLDYLSRELNIYPRKTSSIFPESTTENSRSSQREPCETDSDCHPDFSPASTATPVIASEPQIHDDNGLHEEPPASFSQQHQPQVGSMKGTPGENFPDYTDIPATSFSCSEQDFVPGFYADLESGCQVFHACWPHRMESFLCPMGTTFNQALLACDYWYSSNCSLAPHYYTVVNGYSMKHTETKDTPEGSMMNVLLSAGQEPSTEDLDKVVTSGPETMAFISQFLPVKAKVTIFPETSDSKAKIVATASVGHRKKRHSTKHQDIGHKPQSTAEAEIKEAECPETKYINIEEAVKLFFDRLDDVVKNILRELKNYTAARAAKKTCTSNTDRISILAKIKQKLAPRPLVVPPLVEEEDPIVSKNKDAVDPINEPTVTDFHKPVDHEIRHQKLSISPLTKRALVENYLKLLKLRRS